MMQSPVNLLLTVGRAICLGLAMCCASLAIAEEKMTLALEDADIRELVRWASDYIDKTIVIHPNVKGRVSVIAGEPLSRDEAYNVFLSVLQVHGFAVIEQGNTIKVIPGALAKQASTPVIDENGVSLSEEVVVQVIRVENISAPQLVALLRPLVPQVGHLAAYPNSNVLILADRASNIERIVQIIKRIDQVGTISIEVVTLEHASAKDVVQVINNLLPPSTAKQQGGAAKVFKLTADDRSNSVLMTGDPITRQQVKGLLKRLDTPLAGDGNTQVIEVNYVDAADLVPILEGVSGSIKPDEKSKPFDAGKVSIQASEENNALIITAPPSLLSTLKGVIAKLDVRRPQVLVEALIVEVNNSWLNNLGVAWATDTIGNNSEGVAGGFRSFSADSGLPSVNGISTLGEGVTLGYLRNGDLRAVINMLATDSAANILSTPSILTLDNQEAQILVGSNVPFITGSFTTQGSDSTNPFQTIERQDIGVTLKVTPHINEADSLSLEIEQTVESIAPSSGGASDLITNKREIQTEVFVDNGQTLVLGGLIQDEVTESRSKVPLLGDIPFLGNLFRSNRSETTKNNLMVFIHPIIIREQDHGTEATADYYDDIRQKQQKYNSKTNKFFFPAELPLLEPLSTGKTGSKQEATSE